MSVYNDTLAEVRPDQDEYVRAAFKRIDEMAEQIGAPMNGLIRAGVMAELKQMWEVGFLWGFGKGAISATDSISQVLELVPPLPPGQL